MTDPTNQDRAAWARTALSAFTAEVDGLRNPDILCPGDLAAAIVDLLANLLHYAEQHGLDSQECLHRALGHFMVEKEAGEPPQKTPRRSS